MEQKERTPLWQWFCLLVATTGRSDRAAFRVRQFFAWLFRSKKEVKPGSGAGTAGSIVALLALLLFDWNFEFVFGAAFFSFLVGIFVVTPAAHWLYSCYGRSERHDGTFTCFDYNQINWDEVHGMLIAALPSFFFLKYLGPEYHQSSMLWFDLLVAFVLFRIFDAKKPGIIKKIEKKFEDTDLGVMIDDTAAGIAAAVCSHLFIMWTASFRLWLLN
ncbi:MAG: hypothetical protein UT32_C0015G0008 [Parcubacteria group bacterium GW2011_GWC2_39_14]|nr:MAG: hypothetical protein UT32_C0015G0008 [Parcubacteria group bacterium GW2011_GWC2_39_14]KKR54404.1 MAG: hypothetical protein UT91_C0016G0008 [Parcubacteria group bacterium GW2011_GWA2_40_23]